MQELNQHLHSFIRFAGYLLNSFNYFPCVFFFALTKERKQKDTVHDYSRSYPHCPNPLYKSFTNIFISSSVLVVNSETTLIISLVFIGLYFFCVNEGKEEKKIMYMTILNHLYCPDARVLPASSFFQSFWWPTPEQP